MATEELLSQAVAFLTDPAVQSSPLHKKIEFMESKGLSSEQVQEALRRAEALQARLASSKENQAEKTEAASSSFPLPPLPARTVMLHRPKQEHIWRNLFVGAALLGSLGYSLYYGFKKYIQSHIQAEQGEEESELDSELEKLRSSISAMRQFDLDLIQENEQLKASLASLAEDLKKKDDEFKARLEELLDRVAYLLSEAKESQSAHTNEWRAELTSLRTLFLAKCDTKYGVRSSCSDTIRIVSKLSEEKENKETALDTLSSAAQPPPNKSSIPAWQLAPLDQSNMMVDDFE